MERSSHKDNHPVSLKITKLKLKAESACLRFFFCKNICNIFGIVELNTFILRCNAENAHDGEQTISTLCHKMEPGSCPCIAPSGCTRATEISCTRHQEIAGALHTCQLRAADVADGPRARKLRGAMGVRLSAFSKISGSLLVPFFSSPEIALKLKAFLTRRRIPQAMQML